MCLKYQLYQASNFEKVADWFQLRHVLEEGYPNKIGFSNQTRASNRIQPQVHRTVSPSLCCSGFTCRCVTSKGCTAQWLSRSKAPKAPKAPAGTHCTVTSTSAPSARAGGCVMGRKIDESPDLRRRLQLVAAWMEWSPVAPNAEPQQQQIPGFRNKVKKCNPNTQKQVKYEFLFRKQVWKKTIRSQSPFTHFLLCI